MCFSVQNQAFFPPGFLESVSNRFSSPIFALNWLKGEAVLCFALNAPPETEMLPLYLFVHV